MPWDISFLTYVPEGFLQEEARCCFPAEPVFIFRSQQSLVAVMVEVVASSISRSLSLEGTWGPSGSPPCFSRGHWTRERKRLAPGSRGGNLGPISPWSALIVCLDSRKDLKGTDEELVSLPKFEAVNHAVSVGACDGGAGTYLFKLNTSWVLWWLLSGLCSGASISQPLCAGDRALGWEDRSRGEGTVEITEGVSRLTLGPRTQSCLGMLEGTTKSILAWWLYVVFYAVIKIATA